MKTTFGGSVGSWNFRRLWLTTWNVWTTPHNMFVVLVTAFILIQARAWRIRGLVVEPSLRPAAIPTPAFPQPVVLES
jgi:hypothetical protein